MSEKKVTREQVERAVAALCKHAEDVTKKRQQTKGGKKLQLLEQEALVYVVAGIHHVNPSANGKPKPIAIPHSLTEGGTEVCLIVSKNRKAFKEMLPSLPKNVKKILDVQKIRGQFRTFESRRKLVQSYDVFLVDHRVSPLMPSLLGREFFKKKKTPVPIKVTGGPAVLGPEIERAVSATYVRLRVGPTTSVRAAKLAWPQKKIVDNVLAVAEGIASMTNLGATQKGPWHNVQSLFIKSNSTVSLPIFSSLPPAPEDAPKYGPRLPPSDDFEIPDDFIPDPDEDPTDEEFQEDEEFDEQEKGKVEEASTATAQTAAAAAAPEPEPEKEEGGNEEPEPMEKEEEEEEEAPEMEEEEEEEKEKPKPKKKKKVKKAAK